MPLSSTCRDNDKLGLLSLNECNIVKLTVESLTDLGSICAKDCGVAVGLLNVSWKGVDALLESNIGGRVLVNIIDVPKIIEILLSHALHFLRQGAELGLVQQSDVSSKRFWFSSKFFLFHAFKIVSLHPYEAFRAHKEIISFSSKVMALLVSLSLDNPISQELAEIVHSTIAPVSAALIFTLLNVQAVGDENKVHVIGTLTAAECSEGPHNSKEMAVLFAQKNIHESLFVNTDSEMARMLLAAGRVCTYLNLLQLSSHFSLNTVWELSKRLNWFLNAISGEILHVSLSQVRCILVNMKVAAKPPWQLMYAAVLESLLTFAIRCASSVEAWREIEDLLFVNALHPNIICRDLVLDLWYLILKQSTASLVESHIEALSLLLESISSNESNLSESYRSRMTRIMVMIVKVAPDTGLSWLIQLASDKNSFLSQLSIMVVSYVLQESLYAAYVYNGPVKKDSSQILTSYVDTARLMMELFEAKFAASLDAQKKTVLRLLEVLPVCENHQIAQKLINLTADGFRLELLERGEKSEHSFVNTIFKVLALVFDVRLGANGDAFREHWNSLNDHLLMIAKLTKQDKFKPTLARLLAVLSEIPFLAGEYDAASELYHGALRERHWALVHAGLDSFGHFATRTSCNELWRFVPLDAALLYDIETGSMVNEERFTEALRLYLEKELAQTSLAATEFDLIHMFDNCRVYNQNSQSIENIHVFVPNASDLDNHVDSKSSSLDNVMKAMELMQGLCLLKETITSWSSDPSRYAQELDWSYIRITDFMEEIKSLHISKCRRVEKSQTLADLEKHVIRIAVPLCMRACAGWFISCWSIMAKYLLFLLLADKK